MKKFFALFAFAALAVTMASCGGTKTEGDKSGEAPAEAPKIEGTTIEKTHFSVTQPKTWEVTTDEEGKVEMKNQDEKVKFFVKIVEDTEGYEKALEYNLNPEGGNYKKTEEIEVQGGKLTVLKKENDNFYFVIAPQGADTSKSVKISVSTNRTDTDPITNEEVKGILNSIALK